MMKIKIARRKMRKNRNSSAFIILLHLHLCLPGFLLLGPLNGQFGAAFLVVGKQRQGAFIKILLAACNLFAFMIA